MNTLAARYHGDRTYAIPHADYLRLTHAHTVGVTVLDMLESLQCSGQSSTAPDGEAMASVVAMLTDQLGKVVSTCESLMFAPEATHDC